ncbi:MAG: TIGR00282 family metallophosphoesterase [Candidatus Eisenbacteria bacterium]|nr:TIGR00282 family metallophosphoesterase [Candidatus Eisenbacteria bacterium]
MRILFIGDIVGRSGREAVAELLPGLVESRGIDFTIANGENAAGGIGITAKIGEELFDLGIDVITTGNHVWDKREAFEFLASCDRVLRPANYPPGAAGRGARVYETRAGGRVGVVNLQGRVFMQEIDCPFRRGSELLMDLKETTPVLIVDIHAEATSEKLALGWYLSGQASAVLGTHTHVQTADERILERHTAYITDVGMTGPDDSVIGIKKELSIARFVTQLPQRFEASTGPSTLCAVLIDVCESTGAAEAVERIAVRASASAG